jgi:hypothetical protein
MWMLCDREPVMNWSDRRVTLLGDAAHPMLQYLAQGAGQAIEDAVVLREALRCATPRAMSPRPLSSIERARYLRTARVQLTARFYGDIYHASGVTRELRNRLFQSGTESTGFLGLQWMYDAMTRSSCFGAHDIVFGSPRADRDHVPDPISWIRNLFDWPDGPVRRASRGGGRELQQRCRYEGQPDAKREQDRPAHRQDGGEPVDRGLGPAGDKVPPHRECGEHDRDAHQDGRELARVPRRCRGEHGRSKNGRPKRRPTQPP